MDHHLERDQGFDLPGRLAVLHPPFDHCGHIGGRPAVAVRSGLAHLRPVCITSNALHLFLLHHRLYRGCHRGERERHTLETLLASRISDGAILLGKVLATVGYTFVLVLVSFLLGALVVNLSAKGPGGWQFYSPFGMLIYTLVLSILASLLAAGGGVLISLHSPTVRQATQILLLGTLGLGVALGLGLSALPKSLFTSLTTNQLLLIILGVLVLLDAILLGFAFASFKRSRLILN